MSDKTEHGDWWCPRYREYLSPTRVTNQEACDICGAACYWYSGNELDEIERLTTELDKKDKLLDRAIEIAEKRGRTIVRAGGHLNNELKAELDAMKGGGK